MIWVIFSRLALGERLLSKGMTTSFGVSCREITASCTVRYTRSLLMSSEKTLHPSIVSKTELLAPARTIFTEYLSSLFDIRINSRAEVESMKLHIVASNIKYVNPNVFDPLFFSTIFLFLAH